MGEGGSKEEASEQDIRKTKVNTELVPLKHTHTHTLISELAALSKLCNSSAHHGT